MKILSIYNTCGIHRDNTQWYIKCIESILQQNTDNIDHKIVISSCLNSDICLNVLRAVFKDKVYIISYKDRYTVNVTFNKSIQTMSEKYGLFDGYLYIDSGVLMTGNSVLQELNKRLIDQLYSMITVQIDKDAAYNFMDPLLKYESNEVQIKNNDFIVPLGKANNLHIQLFSKELYQSFNKRIIPDIFAAYCTESTFPFLNAAVNKKWIIMKDIMCHHFPSIDGPSSSQPHFSQIYGNAWNNLLYNRNALDFINDPDAIKYGLGYEECNNIMIHNKNAYDDNNNPLYPEELQKLALKYFFTTEEELNYGNIKYELSI